MKNRHEDYCYICGDLVLAGEGLAETVPRKQGESGWGATKWVVRCAKHPDPVREK